MRIKILLLSLVIFSLFLPSVYAAKVFGTVYSPYLEKLNSAVVSVNSEPKQTVVARDGSYSFNLDEGNYTITARYSNKENYFVEENIKITEEGEFNVDLILFPDLSEDEMGVDDIGEIPEVINVPSIWTYILLAWLVMVFGVIYMMRRTKGHFGDLDDDLDEILRFIKSNNGRVTQLDIRKNFSWSEAKISLIITELEDKGLIKKIKKGRSNVILLEKK
ncbi:MAG: hypothetical protein Q8R00_02315 [Candidatus Nanoarchaeia archaeon]|nr:hypothetical protein [Candidatus Nanoarchaeia archaeon]